MTGRRGDASAELRVEERAPIRGRAHRLHELLVGGLLEHVTAGAGLEGLAGEGGVLVHGQHDHVRLRGLLEEDRDRRQAWIARHVEVEHEHVGAVGAHVAARVSDVAGLGDDLEAVFAVEEHPEAAAHHAVVVGDHDLGHCRQASGRPPHPRR